MSQKRLILFGIASVAIIIAMVAFFALRPSWAGQAKTRGIENFLNQDFDSARTNLNFANFLKPADGETHAYLGYILNRQGRFKETLSEFKKAESLGFQTAGFFRAYGWALRNLNQPDKAVEYYKRAFSLAAPGIEKDAIAQEDLLPLYFQLGDYEKAISEGNELLPRLPETDSASKTRVLELLARALNMDDRQKEAINLLTGSIQEFKTEPRQAKLYSNLAIAYLKDGNLIQAEKAAREALSVTPGEIYPFPYCVLGAVYIDKEDFGTAQQSLESGLRVEPISSDNAYCVHLMARLYRALNQPEKTKQYADEFLSLPIDFTIPEFKLLKEKAEGYLKEISG